jgi:hypothetical protein
VANLAVVAAGTGAQICVTSYAAADVVVDLAAWAPPGDGGGAGWPGPPGGYEDHLNGCGPIDGFPRIGGVS